MQFDTNKCKVPNPEKGNPQSGYIINHEALLGLGYGKGLGARASSDLRQRK